MLSLKKGTQVKVISGKDKGKTGEILEINRNANKVKIKAINMIKKHMKPNAQSPQGGIVEKEAAIQISNLSLLNSKGEATRVGYRMEDEKKVRFAKKSNEVI